MVDDHNWFAGSGLFAALFLFLLKFSFSCRAWQMRQMGGASASLLKIGAPQTTQLFEIGGTVFFERFVNSKSLPFARSPIVPTESAARGYIRGNNFRAPALKLA